ncbi:hypothetical protein LCGC14_1676450 [marine sediment metagenome]|uniref:Uncharacterized protein n=1 Tax=marine sediment metagenome TaxID=412755 RepID=A0A0F9HQG7_9ZZZZ
MLLFEGSYIEVGLVDYTDKFLGAMKNWQKYDYAYREKIEKEILQENYEYLEKEKKKGEEGKFLWGHTYTEAKEYLDKSHLKTLENDKKYDEERKHAEELIQNKLRSLKRITATVIKPEYTEYRNIQSPIKYIELGLKVGPLGYPHYNIENDVLSIVEYQKGEFYDEKQEERTELRWCSRVVAPATYMRTIDTHPLKLMEWYQKLVNKKFW